MSNGVSVMYNIFRYLRVLFHLAEHRRVWPVGIKANTYCAEEEKYASEHAEGEHCESSFTHIRFDLQKSDTRQSVEGKKMASRI